MKTLMDSVIRGDNKGVPKRVEELLAGGATPERLMKEAMIPAMDAVGEQFQKGEIYLPEMLLAARAMKAGMEVLKPRMVQDPVPSAGRVVVGTVRGDMHDIGKNLLIMGLEGAGFEVLDLGIDVPPARFVEAVREHAPQVVALSALLTTTMLTMRETLEALKEAGLRDRVRVMIGGAPVTQEYAEEIGADFYGPDSTSGKDYARRVAGA